MKYRHFFYKLSRCENINEKFFRLGVSLVFSKYYDMNYKKQISYPCKSLYFSIDFILWGFEIEIEKEKEEI